MPMVKQFTYSSRSCVGQAVRPGALHRHAHQIRIGAAAGRSKRTSSSFLPDDQNSSAACKPHRAASFCAFRSFASAAARILPGCIAGGRSMAPCMDNTTIAANSSHANTLNSTSGPPRRKRSQLHRCSVTGIAISSNIVSTTSTRLSRRVHSPQLLVHVRHHRLLNAPSPHRRRDRRRLHYVSALHIQQGMSSRTPRQRLGASLHPSHRNSAT